MSYALLVTTTAVLIPIVVGMISLLTRRDSRSAILVLSASALSLAAINLFIYLLELARIVPFSSTASNYSPYDSIRGLCSNIATYLWIAAWVLSLHRVAQTGRLRWMTAVTVVAMASLVCYVIEREPYYFFSRLTYNIGVAFLLVVGAHVISMTTLEGVSQLMGFAIVARQRTRGDVGGAPETWPAHASLSGRDPQ